MEPLSFILSAVLLFAIIFFAVRLAISPLLNKTEKENIPSQDFGLVKLRDMEVLNDSELEEVIELYQNKSVKKNDYEQYQRYAKVLGELKEMGYFVDEQYLRRLDKLKGYFRVE